MNGAEFLKYYSLCRTGLASGLLKGGLDTLDELFAQTRPASIAARQGLGAGARRTRHDPRQYVQGSPARHETQYRIEG